MRERGCFDTCEIGIVAEGDTWIMGGKVDTIHA